MGIWTSLLLIAGLGVLIWVTVNSLRRNPESLSAANLTKSFYTVGLLTLILIGVCVLCILMLK